MTEDIQMLYESEGLIAIHKPAGMLSIPGDPGAGESLHSSLAARFAARLYVVHRLDREVSGVILFAKNPSAHRSLNEQFSRRTVLKEYLALVHGRLEAPEGAIDHPIREFGSGRMGVDAARGKPSLTRYKVSTRGAKYSLVNVYPATGRRHQIRVHFYALGHPLVGDRRYGDLAEQRKYPRLMLHAAAIEFSDPSTGIEAAVRAPLPDSFRRVCDDLL